MNVAYKFEKNCIQNSGSKAVTHKHRYTWSREITCIETYTKCYRLSIENVCNILFLASGVKHTSECWVTELLT